MADSTPPKTPRWGSSIFSWGGSTAKKEQAKDKRNPFSPAPPARMPVLLGQLDLVSGSPAKATPGGTGFSAVSDRKPQSQQFPASVSKVSFAPSVPHQSPWRAQPSSAPRVNQRTGTPGNQLLSLGGSARKSQKPTVLKRATNRPKHKYRPSSATLNTHMVRAPQKVVDEIRKSLIAPRDLLPPESKQLSLGNVRVLRKGRTLNESHSRLLEARRSKITALPGANQKNSNLLLAMASPNTQYKCTRFQEQINDTSLLMSPQSTGSSQGSSQNISVQSYGEAPPSLRPHSLDEAYRCIPEAGEDPGGVDNALLSGYPERFIPAFLPSKPRKRPSESERVFKVSNGEPKENTESQRVSDSEPDEKQTKKLKKGDSAKEGDSWECKSCGISNSNDESSCTGCGERRKSSKPVVASWGDTFAALKDGWRCETCRVNNSDMSARKCVSCETPRPGFGETTVNASVKGSNTTTESTGGTIGTSGFVFAKSATGPTNGGLSGTTQNKAPATAPSGGGFQFSSFSGGAEKSNSSSGTGFQMPSTTKPVASGTGEEASKMDRSFDKATTGGSMFGGQTSSTSEKTTSATGLSFGGSSSDSKPAQPPPAPGGFSFGTAPSESKAAQPAPAPGGFIFGTAPSESKAAQPAPAPGGLSFGTAPSESKAAQPAPAPGGFIFGTAPSESKAAQPAPAPRGFSFETAPSESKAAQPAPAPGGFSFETAAKESGSLENKSSSSNNVVPTPAPFSFGGPETKSQDSHSLSANGATGFSFDASKAEISKEEKTCEGTKVPFTFGNVSSKDKDEKSCTSSGPPGPSSGFALPVPMSEKKDGKASGMPATAGFTSSDPKSLSSRPPENGGQVVGDSFGGAPFGYSSTSEIDSNRPKKRLDETESSGGPGPLFQFGASRDSTVGPLKAAAPTPSFGAASFGAPAPAMTPGIQFGAQTSSAPSFGQSGFGSTPAPSGQAFGQSGFGSTPTPSGQAFGQAPAPSFVQAPAPSSGPSFVQAPAPSSGPPFGQVPAPSFGQVPAPLFGQAPVPGFGPSSNPAPAPFGGMSAPSPGFQVNFAFGAPVPQPAPTGFGSNATQSYGNPTQPFGAPAQSSSSFGGAPPQFGSAAPQNGGLSQTPVGGFGAQVASATGGFTMGTGATGRRRMIKAKRPKK